MFEKTFIPVAACASLALALSLGGCGGGSSTAASTTVSGTAMAGPFLSGQACAYKVSNGAKGALLGSCANLASSAFTIDIGDYTGDVLIEIAAGATYDDEANPGDDVTGTPLTGSLRSLIHVGSSGGSVNLAVTPLTETAIRLAGVTLNDATVQAALSQLAALLPTVANFDPRTTLPVATTEAGLAYQQMLRALSQMQWVAGGNGAYDGGLDAYLTALQGRIGSNGAGVGADLLGQINAGLSGNCAVTGGVLSCAIAQGGDNGAGAGGLTCNTAHYQAGAVRLPTPDELAGFAKTYNGNTGTFGMDGFASSGAATLVFSSSGGLAYNGASQSVQSICYENNATYGAMLFVEFGDTGAVDLFAASGGGFSGSLPDMTGICGNAPGCAATANAGAGGGSGLSIPGGRSISSAAGVTYMPFPNQPGQIITFSEGGVTLTLYDYQATHTLGIGVGAAGFSIGVSPYNACALDSAGVDANTPTCASVGVSFDRGAGRVSFTHTPMHPIIFTCPGTCEIEGGLSFTAY